MNLNYNIFNKYSEFHLILFKICLLFFIMLLIYTSIFKFLYNKVLKSSSSFMCPLNNKCTELNIILLFSWRHSS